MPRGLPTWPCSTRPVPSGKAPSLLTGKIIDADGNRLTPSHAAKGAKRYRYYVNGSRDLATDATPRVPATDIETLVVDAVRELLLDQSRLADAISTAASAPNLAPVMLRQAIERSATSAGRLADPSDADSASIVRRLVAASSSHRPRSVSRSIGSCRHAACWARRMTRPAMTPTLRKMRTSSMRAMLLLLQ